MGVQGILAAQSSQNQSYQRQSQNQNQNYAMSVGKQLQAFGTTNSNFSREIPISQSDARSFQQSGNLFTQSTALQGSPP